MSRAYYKSSSNSFLKELAIDFSLDDIEATTQIISTSSKLINL